jgi:hypothetical protein
MADDPTKLTGESVIASVLLPDAFDLAAEYAEVGLDAFVDNAALDGIPVVRTVRALAHGVADVREALFVKKLVALIFGVGSHTADDVARWRTRLDDEKQATEIGERVLALVDRVATTTKATLIGHALRAYLDGQCDRSTFLRTAEMIDNALSEDLADLLRLSAEDIDEAASNRLIAAGLMEDRSAHMLLESSKPPVASAEGTFLLAATKGSERRT